MNRYFINDFGLINAMGSNKHAVFSHWLNHHSKGMMLDTEFNPNLANYIAKVTDPLPSIDAQFNHYNCRNNQLLLAAYQQIQTTVENAIAEFKPNRIAIVLGTSTSGIANGEEALAYYFKEGAAPDNYHFKQQDIGTVSHFLAAYTGITGPCLTISTACSSSGNAFNTARRLLALDLCDVAIVGGADSLCKMTVQGFASLESISTTICQPFSKNRQGINIGEAAALFVLSKRPSNIELYGVGTSSDAHHISAPDPSAKGACISMQAAITQSPFASSDIDYINLHGTATPLNDAMESLAVHTVFGSNTPCSSTKSLTGHTLGAAAATEAALCCLLLSELNAQKIIPAQYWDKQFDPALPNINIVSQHQTVSRLKLCLSNSFAFGGNNVSLLLGHPYETF